MNLYLDDERIPSQSGYDNSDWVVMRDPREFIEIFKNNLNIISNISLDHDLGYIDKNTGLEVTGYDVLKKMSNICFDLNININKYNILFHTSNPVGKFNMSSYLNNFKEYVCKDS